MIVGNASAGLGRRVSVWDRLEVNGTLWVSGVQVVGSSIKNKQDVSELSQDDYSNILNKIKSIPLFHYRFKNPLIADKKRIGVIAEQSPDEILDETKTGVSFLDYAGFILAGLKAQNAELEGLKATVQNQQKQIDELKKELKELKER